MTDGAPRRPVIGLSVALGTALVVIAVTGVDWPAVGHELAQAKLVWLAVALLFYAGIVVCWTAQWRTLLPRGMRIPYGRMFEIVAIMAMVANTVPYMVGQGTGAVLLATRGRVGHAAAVGVVALEQLAEGITKLGFILLAAVLIPLPGWLLGALVGVSGSILVLVGVFAGAVAWHRFTPMVADAVRPGWWAWFRRMLQPLAQHLESVGDWRVFGLGLAWTVGMKLTEAFGIAAVQYAFGVVPSVGAVVLVLVATNTATMVSLVPGNLGVYEGAAYLAYGYLGIPAEQAVGLGVAHHLCTLATMVGAGYLVVLTRHATVPGTGRIAVMPRER